VINCSKVDFSGTFLCAVTSYILNFFGLSLSLSLSLCDVSVACVSLSDTL
jgi:hypothetical protein